MIDAFDCPNPFCDASIERPAAADDCPTCRFPVDEWLEHHRGREETDRATGEVAASD